MSKESVKIIIALAISFLLTQLLSQVFLANSPRLNRFYLSQLFARKPTTTPTPTIIPTETPTPTILAVAPTVTIIPTRIIYPTFSPTSPVSPTRKPTTKLTPTGFNSPPTGQPVSTSCPTTSTNRYHDQGVGMSDPEKLSGDLSTHPEVNLYLRGWTEVNEGKQLIGMNNYQYKVLGLDDKMPPQISSLYNGPIPTIIKTYRIFEWDFQNRKSLAPQTASPDWPVHMIGLQASPGQPLYGLKAGRIIDSEGDVFITLYATKNYILFSHSADDNIYDGYLYYFVDICVDPNLLSQYENANNAGRRVLPAVAPGQVFGYAASGEVKYVIRDTMSFMDTRYKRDWWFYGQ